MKRSLKPTYVRDNQTYKLDANRICLAPRSNSTPAWRFGFYYTDNFVIMPENHHMAYKDNMYMVDINTWIYTGVVRYFANGILIVYEYCRARRFEG